MQHLNWDNLRYMLMVATQGSIAAAARELGVNRTTVLRRINTFVAVKIAAEHGLGLSLLPRFLGDSSNKLERLEAPTEELTRGLWLLTHPDLVRSAKVHAFIEHFSEALAEAL